MIMQAMMHAIMLVQAMMQTTSDGGVRDIVLITLLVKINRYGSFLVDALNFLKFTQILSFPFFLNIIIIGNR